MPLVAGVDSSTGSTKVEIREADTGALVATGAAPHPSTNPPRSEQDPATWWTAFEGAWAAAGNPAVDAIAIAGQQHGMVVLDSAHDVVRPAKLWNDTESAPDSGWLLKQRSASQWVESTGSVPLAAFTVTKLSWLHRSEPHSWARLAHVVLPHDWLTSRLTGRLTTDRGDASGTGYWNPSTGQYCWDVLAMIDAQRDWADVVPKVLGPLESAGEWEGAVVAAGTGDNMAAALGVGLQPGDVALSIGTSGTAYTVDNCAANDPSGTVAGFADATGRYLPLACTLNATKVTDSFARLLGLDRETFERVALEAPSGANGLTLLPYLDGERTPNRPLATGVLAGIRTTSTPGDIARAAFEAVACGLLDALDGLAAVTTPSDGPIVLVGGGARARAFRQIIADLSGRIVVTPDASEHVATGACVQAAAVLGQRPFAEFRDAWSLGAGSATEPSISSDAASAVRSAYGVRRDREV